MKRAVIYYSLSNNTKIAADKIGEALGIDVFRIDLAKPLPNNKAGQMIEGGRQVTFGVKPELKDVPDYSSYDEIIIGTPIWAGKCASPFNTLFEDKDLCSKVVAAFTYSGGGDNAGCISAMKKILPNLSIDVALSDMKSKFAPQNDEKIADFIKKISER